MARLKDQYINEIAPALNKKFGYKSVMQIPKLDKVVINVACGEAKENEKILEAVMKDLAQITGQKAVICRAKKSVANFKLRAGTPIGCKVTLRGERMYEFVDRFFNVALPRVRDFRGINGNAFDGRGNFACGIKEQIIFPEIDFDKVDAVRGMDVCFVTTAKTSRTTKGGDYQNGKAVYEAQAGPPCKVLHPRLHPLPHLRPAPLCAAQVRHLPRVLP